MPQSHYTTEQQEDIKTRVTAFMEEYNTLIKKYDVQIASYPAFQSIPNGMYGVSVELGPLDTKYLPTPSPIQQP